MLKTLAAGTIGAATVCAAALGAVDNGAAEERFEAGTTRATLATEQTIAAKAGGSVEVDNASGAIQVTGWDEPEVRLVVTKSLERYTGWSAWLTGPAWTEDDIRASMELVLADARWVGDTLMIDIEAPGGDWPDGLTVDVELRVPRATPLALNTDNGAIDVQDVDARVAAGTANGAITMNGIGGWADADSANGEIRLEGIGGYAKARTTNGAITCRGAAGSIDLETANGAIEAVHAGSESVRCATGNGTIRVALAETHGHALSMRTQTGQVRCDAPLDDGARVGSTSVEATVRGGGPTIELRSGNGSIELAQL
jgi:hypothetical protein